MIVRNLRHAGFAAFAAVSVVAYGGMVWAQWSREAPLHGVYILQTIGWYLLAFGAYVGTLIWVERRGRASMRWVWGTAVLFRLIFLLATPTLSNDFYRYLWDGYVANQGVSPYAYAIDAPELDYLDIPLRQLANHSWMASPYLPATQIVFFGLAFAFPLKPIFVQIVMIIFDLLSAVVVAKLLALASLPRRRLLIYLWNPLVIVEIAYSAHVDAWMVLLALTAVYLTLRDLRFTIYDLRFLAPIFLALATLTKIIPVLLAPVLFWRWSWRQRILYVVVTLGLLAPSGLRAGWGLTGALDGTGLFGALRIYNDQWNYNSGLFHWLERWLGAPGYGRPSATAKLIMLAIMILVMFVVWWLAREKQTIRGMLRLTAVPFMAYILLTPTVHPWYLLILLAFVPFLSPGKMESGRQWLSTAPWLYLSGTLIFSYITYMNPLDLGEREWVRQLEWIPTLFLLTLCTFVLPALYQPRKPKLAQPANPIR